MNAAHELPANEVGKVIFPVEIKANIDGSVPLALAALDDPAPDTRRQIWFVEGRAGLRGGQLPLLSAGVIVRIRSGGEQDDSTAKLRPVDLTQLTGRWAKPFDDQSDHKSLQYQIEGDWSGERHLLAASAVVSHSPGTLAVRAGFPEAALTKQQQKFLDQCATVHVDIADLEPLGPIMSTKWSDVRLSGGVKVNIERWTVLDLDFLELSIRVKPKPGEKQHDFSARAAEQQSELVAAIETHALRLATNTDNKTQRVLKALASATNPEDAVHA